VTRSRTIDREESYPPCPECGHNVFVHPCKRQYNDWICESCGRRWHETTDPRLTNREYANDD
jgi:predicted RNA-binding Zn-ribbon protein involved in translation (DUF1610 family)